MKKLLLILSLFAMVCFANANPVDQNTAKEIGSMFLKASAKMGIVGSSDLQLITTYRTSDNEAAFYIFNTEHGFVIVSAVDYAIPILGYSDEGQFHEDNIPVQMEEYLQGFVEQIQYGKDVNLSADEETALQWELVKTTGRINNEKATNAVSPLLSTVWDQSQNYNNMCPTDSNGPGGHVFAGCVAAAMGQIMKYWGYPTTGNGSHTYTPSGYPQQSANFGATTYDWSNMPNQLTASSTSTQINAVAKLLWHCGISVNMMYGFNGSGAFDSDAASALTTYFRYSTDLSLAYKNDYTNSSWFALMKSYLDQGIPMYYSGNNANYDSGHAFVCDGYNSSNQLHFNWGWSGYYNCYFSLGALIPYGSDNYSYINCAIVNIHPTVASGTTCQINVSASPTAGGTVTGSGSYPKYQTCTITATPSDGFEFLGWKENDVIVSNEATYSFAVRQNRTLTAVFSLSAISSVSANYYPDANNPESPYVEVSWSGSHVYSYDFDRGLPDGWALIDADGDNYNWYEVLNNGELFGHNGSNGFMTSASWSNDPLTPNNYLVSPQFTASAGSTFSFWASAADASWAGEHFGVAVSTTSQTMSNSFTTIQEWTMTAKTPGTWHQYSVDLSNYAGQNVYIAIRHFNCTDKFRLNVDDVEFVSTNGSTPPTPPSGTTYDFDDNTMMGWTSIDADGDGNGWVSSSAPGIYHYANTNLSGTGHNASEAYVISGSYANQTGQALTPNNFLVSPTKAAYNQISFYACAQDGNYAAEHFGVAVSTTNNTNASAFTTIQEWTMTAKSSGAMSQGRGGQIRQGNWYGFTVDLSAYAGQQIWVAIRHFNCTDQFILNVDDITLSSSKDTKDGAQIQYYKVYRTNCSNNGPYTPSNTTTLASQYTGASYIDNTWNNVGFGSYKFGVSTVAVGGTESAIIWSGCIDKGVGYTISATADPAAGGTVNGAGLYEQGTTCTLTATPNTGYAFVNWTKNGTAVSTNASYSFTVTENASYVAHFNLITYNITVSANPAAGGNVTGGGVYNQGATANLVATANPGYTFVNWTKNGTAVSTNASYSFTVNETASYVANFSQNTYTITATADPASGGTATGGGTFTYGETCTLTATPSNDFNFINWTKNGTVVSANPTYSFTVTESGDYVAHFSQNVYYSVIATANPTEGGNVTGSGTFQQGETCTLHATANTGFTFLNWTRNGNVVSTNSTYSFVVNETGEYVANFNRNTYSISASVNPTNGGTVTGTGTYEYGETATLSVTPNTNFVFDNWTENGVVVSEEMTMSVVVTEVHNYVANLHSVYDIDENDDVAFNIYPNPVDYKMMIESREIVRKCDIYTVSGSLVASEYANSSSFEMEVGSLRAGTYIIRLTTDNGVHTMRFVKK